MASEVATVLAAVRTMPREQVADLAYQVLRVLDEAGGGEAQPAVEAAWDVELRRRVDDLEGGTVTPVSHRDTVETASALLADRRPQRDRRVPSAHLGAHLAQSARSRR